MRANTPLLSAKAVATVAATGTAIRKAASTSTTASRGAGCDKQDVPPEASMCGGLPKKREVEHDAEKRCGDLEPRPRIDEPGVSVGVIGQRRGRRSGEGPLRQRRCREVDKQECRSEDAARCRASPQPARFTKLARECWFRRDNLEPGVSPL